jgi:hypothetical protein
VSILKFDESNVTFEYLACPVTRGKAGRMYICQAISTNAYLRPAGVGTEDKFTVTTTWEDGSDIQAALIEEVNAAARAAVRPIKWQQGDCLVVDNNRVLHGRNETTDGNRLLFILCSFSCRYKPFSMEENHGNADLM